MKDLTVVDTIIVNNQPIEFKSSGNEIYTDSLTVAKVFGKRHDNVLRDIEEEISLLNIEESNLEVYTESTYVNSRGRSNKYYYLTRDQFTLLVMGFTGEKARVTSSRQFKTKRGSKSKRAVTVTKD